MPKGAYVEQQTGTKKSAENFGIGFVVKGTTQPPCIHEPSTTKRLLSRCPHTLGSIVHGLSHSIISSADTFGKLFKILIDATPRGGALSVLVFTYEKMK